LSINGGLATLDLAGPATLTIFRGGEGRIGFIAVEVWIDYCTLRVIRGGGL
jgi:hypothetical protein